MYPAIALALLLSHAGSAPATVDANERVALGLVLVAPAGELGGGTSRSEIIRLTDQLLREHTSLRQAAYETAVVSQTCPEGQYRCLIEKLIGAEETHWLSVISFFPVDAKRARVAASLVEVAAAHRCTSAGEDDPEACIVKAATRDMASSLDEKGVQEFLSKFFLTTCRAPLEAAGAWEPYGLIELTFPRSGFSIDLDGRLIGMTGPGTTRIEHVLPGKRRLGITAPELDPQSAEIEVARDKTSALELTLPDASGIRRVVFWSGVGLAAAGAGVGAYSLFTKPDRIQTCTPGACRQVLVGTGSSDDIRDVSGHGIRLGPAGLALLGAGATWSLGSLIGPSLDTPWIQIAAGVVVFGATYALGVAIGEHE